MKAVLVVEDLPDIRAWLVETAHIAFPGTEVVAAGRCREGIDALARQAFDVVLVDLELPDGSGVSVIRALRQQQPVAVPVVVTIHDDDEHLFPALQDVGFAGVQHRLVGVEAGDVDHARAAMAEVGQDAARDRRRQRRLAVGNAPQLGHQVLTR